MDKEYSQEKMRPSTPCDSTRHALEKFANECVECGNCLDVCSLLDAQDLVPGQIVQQVLDEGVSPESLRTIQRCSLCGLCSIDCPVDVPLAMMGARSVLLETGGISIKEYQSVLVDQDWHFFTLYRDTYGIDYQDLKRECCETLFFPGCSLASYAPLLTRSACTWIEGQGDVVGISEECCGMALSSIGLIDRAAQHVARLRQQISAAGVRKIVAACPNCCYYLKSCLHGVEVVSLYEMMAKAGIRLAGSQKLTVHDSCPDRAEGIIGREVRRLLGGYSLVEMKHHGQQTICCGSGGIVSQVDPLLCNQRASARMEEFKEAGADKCITACMGCATRLSRVEPKNSMVHYLELAFNQYVDYAHVQAKVKAMWEGEWGEYNRDRLSNALAVTVTSKG